MNNKIKKFIIILKEVKYRYVGMVIIWVGLIVFSKNHILLGTGLLMMWSCYCFDKTKRKLTIYNISIMLICGVIGYFIPYFIAVLYVLYEMIFL